VFVTVDDPGRGPVTIPGYPVKMSRSPARVVAPPQPGQHTAEVLREWLGESAPPPAAARAADEGATDEGAERIRLTPEAPQ
jgi:crotonobetainyl-CoA:carnitine CoA-transferase CaiB-like acyl-CoA transferase